MNLAALVAQFAVPSTAPLPYRPFISPLPLWDYWYVLIIPLCLGVSIVYKAMRVPDLKSLPRQAIVITLWTLAAMGAAAVVLMLLVNYW